MTVREVPHGSASTYRNHGCRCAECRAAHAAASTHSRNRRSTRLATADVKHGRYTTYSNWGCRCDECRAAWATYNRDLAARRRAAP